MRKVYFAIAALIAGAGSVNLIRIDQANLPIDPAETIEAHTRMPQNVSAILQRACHDCHSERTEWPWYGKVAPFQWLITADVYAARAHMNLSSWARYKPEERTERLIGICEMVAGNKMPLLHYKLGHYPAAWLSQGDKKAVCDWVKSEVGLSAAADDPGAR